MHFSKRSYTHIKLTDYQYAVLKDLAETLGIPVSKLINILIPKLSKLLGKDFDIKIDYSAHLTLLDKVDNDKERIVSPHISLTRENHIFLQNIKNRNFRASFAMLIRLIIEEFLIKGEGKFENSINMHHSPISYAVFILLTPEIQLLSPLNEQFLPLLL